MVHQFIFVSNELSCSSHMAGVKASEVFCGCSLYLSLSLFFSLFFFFFKFILDKKIYIYFNFFLFFFFSFFFLLRAIFSTIQSNTRNISILMGVVFQNDPAHIHTSHPYPRNMFLMCLKIMLVEHYGLDSDRILDACDF